MSILNWLKSIFGKKSNEVISYRQDINEDPDKYKKKYPNALIMPEKRDFGYIADLRYCSYNNRDQYDANFGDILIISFNRELHKGQVFAVTIVYYSEFEERVHYYTGFEPQKVRNHRQYNENRNNHSIYSQTPISRNKSSDYNSSTSIDDSALLNPLSPTNIWNTSDDSSSSSYDSSSSSTYDSGCDSGGDCGGGD